MNPPSTSCRLNTVSVLTLAPRKTPVAPLDRILVTVLEKSSPLGSMASSTTTSPPFFAHLRLHRLGQPMAVLRAVVDDADLVHLQRLGEIVGDGGGLDVVVGHDPEHRPALGRKLSRGAHGQHDQIGLRIERPDGVGRAAEDRADYADDTVVLDDLAGDGGCLRRVDLVVRRQVLEVYAGFGKFVLRCSMASSTALPIGMPKKAIPPVSAPS